MNFKDVLSTIVLNAFVNAASQSSLHLILHATHKVKESAITTSCLVNHCAYGVFFGFIPSLFVECALPALYARAHFLPGFSSTTLKVVRAIFHIVSPLLGSYGAKWLVKNFLSEHDIFFHPLSAASSAATNSSPIRSSNYSTKSFSRLI